MSAVVLSIEIINKWAVLPGYGKGSQKEKNKA
jgi:hypothetical protein